MCRRSSGWLDSSCGETERWRQSHARESACEAMQPERESIAPGQAIQGYMGVPSQAIVLRDMWEVPSHEMNSTFQTGLQWLTWCCEISLAAFPGSPAFM